MILDPKRFILAYKRDKLIVKVKIDLYNYVAIIEDRELDTFYRSIIDIDILSSVVIK